jgi:hypothetical protein
MKKSLFGALAAVTVLGTIAAPLPARADGGCIPGDTAGLVPRQARPADMVCATPHIAAEVQKENLNAAMGQGYVPGGGAYGPKTCISGLVWREAFDGDTVCVSTQRRQETWQENANAGVGATGGLAPQTPPQSQNNNGGPGHDTVILESTGNGRMTNVVFSDPVTKPAQYDVALPFSHTVRTTLKSGDLYQIVGTGNSTTQVGCRITVNGTVVAEHDPGAGDQCVYTVP